MTSEARRGRPLTSSTGPVRVGLTALAVAAAALGLGCGESDADSAFSVPRPGEVRPFTDTVRPIPPLRRAETPPPPIGASTLTIEGSRALVSDADRDRVVLVDLRESIAQKAWAFAGAEPGRVVFAPGGDAAYVVLRRAGAVARLELIGDRRATTFDTCPAPRGIAVDAAGALHVACLGGKLVTHAPDGAPLDSMWLAPDLRDVVVADDGTRWISRLRSAEVFRVAPDQTIERVDLDAIDSAGRVERGDDFAATVAWRLRLLDDGVMVVHQGATVGEVRTEEPSGYGSSGCSPGIVGAVVTTLDHSGAVVESRGFPGLVLPVDGVRAGSRTFVAAPGNHGLRPTVRGIDEIGCFDDIERGSADDLQIVALDRGPDGALWAFSREPAALVGLGGETITLGGESVFDTGHDLFHVDAGGGIACASCHPEGGEDGHTWTFSDTGPRRTQPLNGGLKGTEPFHWAGELVDLTALSAEVFAHRMGGPIVDRRYLAAWIDWIDSVPMPVADLGVNRAAAERGEGLFHDATVGCAGCHQGSRLADGGTYDVGTGEPLQTPTLRGIGLRGPFMHDGCAETLAERFDACGGGDAHGQVSDLAPNAVADLVEYLRTL